MLHEIPTPQDEPLLRGQSVRTVWLQPCRMNEPFATVDPSGVSRHDHDLVERLTAIADITGAVAGIVLDPVRPLLAPADLSALLTATAAAATRRLDGRIVAYFPDGPSTPGAPSDTPAGADSVPAQPDLCVPVVAGEPRPVGHLHQYYDRPATPNAADRVTLELLAGHAVDLAAVRAREREQEEVLAQLRRQVAELRDDAAHLAHALESNRQIGVAIGVIAALEKSTPERAFGRLRAASQNSNRKLYDIACEVVLTGEIPPSTSGGGSRTGSARRRCRGPARAGAPDVEPGTDRRHHIDLTLRRDTADLRLGGELDLAARADLLGLLDRLAPLATPIRCDASGVTFADSHGLGPLVAAARRRHLEGQAPVVLVNPSRAVERAIEYMDAAHLLDPQLR